MDDLGDIGIVSGVGVASRFGQFVIGEHSTHDTDPHIMGVIVMGNHSLEEFNILNGDDCADVEFAGSVQVIDTVEILSAEHIVGNQRVILRLSLLVLLQLVPKVLESLFSVCEIEVRYVSVLSCCVIVCSGLFTATDAILLHRGRGMNQRESPVTSCCAVYALCVLYQAVW